MNTRLLVLGVLHRGNFHPYEIKRRLKAALVECYINVDVGTLYYAVRALEKERLIEEAAREAVGRGGIRTIYRITTQGRREFRQCLQREIESDGPVAPSLYGALLFLHLADPELVTKALRQKVEHLTDLIEKLEPMRRQFADSLSTGGKHLLDHIEQQRRLDREWLRDLLADIDANGIKDVKDPSKLARS
ncbi:MAG TPA: PadR family transcriptional regulator [Sphingomicrobium sp.]|nr:PadR family transcriptional regulator [Sphingomicrobium sp.]